MDIQVLSASPAGIIIHVSIPGMWVTDTIVDGITFQRISIPGTKGTLNQIGLPELPRIARYYALPPSSGTVVSEANATMQVLTDYLIFPEQHYGSTGFQINPQAYAEDSFSPIEADSTGVPAVMRNVRMGKAFFCPFQYNPALRILKVIPEVDITLSFEGIDTRNNIPGFPSVVAPQINTICRSLALGYGDVYSGSSMFSSANNTYGKHYLVIVAQNWWDNKSTNGLDLYLEWLRHRGYQVETATVGSGDNVSTLKNGVNGIIDVWYNQQSAGTPLYVLLIGDAPNHNPTAEGGGLNPDQSVQGCSNEKIATWGGYPCIDPIEGIIGTTWSDYYYCLMDGDETPDIAIGRWCLHSNQELTNIIAKQFAYERDIDEDWTMDEGLFVAFDGNPWRLGKENILESDWWANGNLTGDMLLYTDANMAYIRGEITNKLNTAGGVSLVNYRGHAGCYAWHQPGDPFTTSGIPFSLFSRNHIYNSLTNTSWPPLVFSVACLSGCITARYGESMVEAWTNDENGAVGAWGASRVTHTLYNNDLDFYLFEGLFEKDKEGLLTTGDDRMDVGYSIIYAKEHMRAQNGFSERSLQDARAYYWVGDPGLRAWYGGIPEGRYSGIYLDVKDENGNAVIPYAIPIGEPVDITIKVRWIEFMPPPLPGVLIGPEVNAQVGLYKQEASGDLIRFGYTVLDAADTCGIITFYDLVFTSPGTIHITATRQKDNPPENPYPMYPCQETAYVEGDRFQFEKDDILKPDEGIKWSLSCPPSIATGRVVFNYFTPQPGQITLKIYEASGRMVKGFDHNHNTSGYYKFTWDGKDQSNLELPGGVYFWEIGTHHSRETGKFVYVK